MDYQLYEILLLFSIYSIAGWIFEVFLFALQNKGFAVGLVMWLLSALVINGFCGAKVIHLKWYYPILAGFGAWILILQLNPLLVVFIKRLPSWIHMVFLLVYWVRSFPELGAGMMELNKFKKTHTLHRHAE